MHVRPVLYYYPVSVLLVRTPQSRYRHDVSWLEPLVHLLFLTAPELASPARPIGMPIARLEIRTERRDRVGP